MDTDTKHEIAKRYHRGKAAWDRFRKNCQESVAKDLGMHTTCMIDALSGRVKNTRLTRSQMDEARERLSQSRVDRALASKDSIAAIKREYRISSDTLNRIVDSVCEPKTAVQKFLTMRLR